MGEECAVPLLVCLLLLSVVSAVATPHPELGIPYAAPPSMGRELIGTRPLECTLSDWQGSEPLTLAALRGKVVLIRWWTAPGCPYCAASADASTTLTLVTIRPNDRRRIIWRADTETPDLCEKLAGAQLPFRPDSFLDNGQQLTLQRSVVPLRPPA